MAEMKSSPTSRDTSAHGFAQRDAPASPPPNSPHKKAPSLSNSHSCISEPSSQPYSSFTKRQKWLITVLTTVAASFSPLSSFVFFPAIQALARSLHVSIARVNLTITSYMIVAGIAPALLGNLADMVGRRTVYIFMISIYCLANIGLALQSNWTALFVLRMVQSVGSASTIAIGYGVVSDIATPAERGEFVSGMVLGPNIATAVGPIIGGALTESPGWRWIFWLLSILSGVCFVLVILLLPETARSVVGNGSDQVSALRRPPLSLFSSTPSTPSPPPEPQSRNTRSGKISLRETPDQKRFSLPNPMASLNLLLAKDCISIVLIFGIFYMNLSCLQASTSTLFINLYGISELQAGVIYLPSGIGSIIGAYVAGYILRYDYRVTARKYGITINVQDGDDMTTFPIEQARLRSIGVSISTAGLCTIGFGWALRYRAHMAVPLILQFIIGISTAIVFNTSGTLLTDIHPKSPSTASAANSIIRCFLSGGGLALIQIFIDSIGIQWTFTLFGVVSLSSLGIAWVEFTYGKYWRDKMRENGIER